MAFFQGQETAKSQEKGNRKSRKTDRSKVCKLRVIAAEAAKVRARAEKGLK